MAIVYKYIDKEGLEKNTKVNLGKESFNKLVKGDWELGFINDNPGLDDETNDKFYHDENDILLKNEIHRSFNNKITVNLCNGETKLGHLIHWCPNVENGFFCKYYSILFFVIYIFAYKINYEKIR